MSHQLTKMPDVHLSHGRPTTTSLNIAQVFGKQHKNVLRDIQQLEIPDEFRRLNFQPAEYLDAQKKPRPMYEVTRDGFTLLAMGFTGRRAMQFKLAYIQAFNRMEAELARRALRPATRAQALAGKVGNLSRRLRETEELLELYRDRCELLALKLAGKAGHAR